MVEENENEEQTCDCCDECCCCEVCECDGCSPEVEAAEPPAPRSWFRRTIAPFLPAIILFSILGGCYMYGNRHNDYTVVAMVGSKSLDNKSKNPFDPSGTFEYTLNFEFVPQNASASTNWRGLCDIWLFRSVSREHYERVEKDKWYKIRVRYYPSTSLFRWNDYDLLAIEDGPLDDPRKPETEK